MIGRLLVLAGVALAMLGAACGGQNTGSDPPLPTSAAGSLTNGTGLRVSITTRLQRGRVCGTPVVRVRRSSGSFSQSSDRFCVVRGAGKSVRATLFSQRSPAPMILYDSPSRCRRWRTSAKQVCAAGAEAVRLVLVTARKATILSDGNGELRIDPRACDQETCTVDVP